MGGGAKHDRPSGIVVDAAKALFPAREGLLELPATSKPRWFVPISNRQVRWSGSKIYPALNWKRRAYRMLLRGWISSGAARFTHRVINNPEDEWPLGNLLASYLPELFTAAVSLGPPGPGQKVTIQLMDRQGRILGYAKYADKPLTRARIRNEARMLKIIPRGVGPHLVLFAPFMDGDLLVQTPLSGRPRTPRLRLDEAEARLMKKLEKPEKVHSASEHPFVKELYARIGDHRGAVERVVAHLDGDEWPVVLMHGDLAPWNMLRWRGNYSVFDWEVGTEAGFAYVDPAYTLIQVASLVRKTNPWRAKRTIPNLLREWLPSRHVRFASTIAELSALYTLVSWYPRDAEVPYEANDHEQWLKIFVQARS